MPCLKADMATTISAPRVGRTFIQLSAEGTVRLSSQSYLYYGATAEARQGKSALGVQAGLRASF